MRLDRSPIFNLLASRNRPTQDSEGVPFDGAEYWKSQLSNPATLQTWWDLANRVSLRQFGHPVDAQDNASETIAAVLAKGHTYKGGNHKAWFLRVSTNEGYTVLRRKATRPTVSLEEHEEQKGGFVHDNSHEDPEKAALRSIVRDAIGNALQRLPGSQREVAIICDMQGLSYEEAAKELEVSVGTIKSRLSRAGAKLRKNLIAEGISGFDFLAD